MHRTVNDYPHPVPHIHFVLFTVLLKGLQGNNEISSIALSYIERDELPTVCSVLLYTHAGRVPHDEKYRLSLFLPEGMHPCQHHVRWYRSLQTYN